MAETIQPQKQEIARNEETLKKAQSMLALVFKCEVNRFMNIKGSTELTVAELDTISINAARNYFKLLQDGK